MNGIANASLHALEQEALVHLQDDWISYEKLPGMNNSLFYYKPKLSQI
jgi:hypothetical protein